jgi:hypothetical protein
VSGECRDLILDGIDRELASVAIRFAVQVAKGRRANPGVDLARRRNVFRFVQEGLAGVLHRLLDLFRGALGEASG